MNTTYPRTSSLAVISLVFGFFGIFGLFGFIAIVKEYVFVLDSFALSNDALLVMITSAPAAVICGQAARSRIRRAPPGCIKGNGMALTGLILGWTPIGLAIGWIILLSTGFLGRMC